MKQLKFLFLVLIGVLVSTAFTSCGSDDEPQMPSEDELYQQWLEDATAQYDVVKDKMAYYIQDGKAILYTVFPAISGAITIPSEVYYEGTGKNYPVKVVQFQPDMTSNKVTSLLIPSSVEQCQIAYLPQIKTLTIPASVTYFEIIQCNELASLSFSEGVENIIVSECPKIISVALPESVKQLNLISLNITEVTVPSGIETVEFRCCEKLEKVNNLENSSLKGLGTRAFYKCTSLKELYLPQTASYIYYGCCEGATSLNKVHCLRTTPPRLRDSNYGAPFSVMDNLYVPKGCKEAYKEAYPWSEFKEIIEE